MKKVLIIAPQVNPIPAVKDGAVEWLITYLLDENEKYDRVKFIVVSKYDEGAKKITYKNTIIYFIKKTDWKIGFELTYFFRKLLFNRFTKHFFTNHEFDFKELTLFGYQCNKIAKRNRPDIIVSEGYDKIHTMWPILKWFSVDNVYYHLHYSRNNNEKVRKMFPNTIAVSNYVLKKWEKGTVYHGRSVVIRNGIDLSRFAKSIIGKQNRFKFGFNKNDFIILFSGRFRPGKGIKELLDAFDIIEDPTIKLLMVGDFDPKEYYNEIEFEATIRKRINKNKNIIHVGFVPYHNIGLYYDISDIQVIPSIYDEAAGLVAIEGMAKGLPLIITSSGGMPEYTGNNCAIVLDRNEELVSNIAKSILLLKNDRELYITMSLVGEKRARLFSKENYYKQYMDFLLNKDIDNE